MDWIERKCIVMASDIIATVTLVGRNQSLKLQIQRRGFDVVGKNGSQGCILPESTGCRMII
jgi:hypothetical protein